MFAKRQRKAPSRSGRVRLWLSVIPYNLGNLWRRFVLPKRIDAWSLTDKNEPKESRRSRRNPLWWQIRLVDAAEPYKTIFAVAWVQVRGDELWPEFAGKGQSGAWFADAGVAKATVSAV